MKNINKLQNGRLIFIFALFLLTELIIEAGYIWFDIGKTLYLTLQTTTICTIMAIIFLIQRRLNKTTDELNQSKQKLQDIFDTLDVAIWSHDLVTDNLLITTGIEKLYGVTLQEFYKDKLLWKKMIHQEDMPVISEREKLLSLGKPATSTYRIIRPDQEVRWIMDRGIPIFGEEGKFINFTSVLFDITDRKESEDRYQSLVEMSPDIIAVVSRGKIDYINTAGCKLIGATHPEELIGQKIERYLPVDITENMNLSEETVPTLDEKFHTFEFSLIRLDGTSIDVEMSAMPILFEGRIARHVVGRDISERKQAEKTIQFMAYHDALTRLPNRFLFRRQLDQALRRQGNKVLAVMFIDLDRFKIINDSKGHSTGDILLTKVAGRIQEVVREDGIVSRQGGDEFIILLEDTSKEHTALVAQQLLDQFNKPIEINQQEYVISASIGISLYPTDGEDQETLIKYADTAMYHAKEKGKNNYQFYTPQLLEVFSHKMEMESELRKALEQNQMLLYYQPQIEMPTGKLIGVEALIRWQHPQYGMISPAQFIPIAEETGLIIPLGKWVLTNACLQNKLWQDAGYEPFPIAVNVSVRQMEDDQFVHTVQEVLKQNNLDARYLELEITESIMQNIGRSTEVLNQLKALGVRITIDDFGTGYSSLSYLKHLPIDSIKIDKSFIDDIGDDTKNGAMVKTIIDMGHNLNFIVVAEGIEQQEQVNFLIQSRCTIGQGYYFSTPVPLDKIEEYIEVQSYTRKY